MQHPPVSTSSEGRSQAELGDRFLREALPWLEAVRRFALSLTGEEGVADRLTERTFVRARNSWSAVRSHADARCLLLVTCRNLFTQSMSSSPQEIVQSATASDAAEDVRGTGRVFATVLRDGLGDIWASDDVATALTTAFGRLSPQCRAALMLIDVDAVPDREAADVLGVTEGEVRALLFHGRRTLQELLLLHVSERRRDSISPSTTDAVSRPEKDA